MKKSTSTAAVMALVAAGLFIAPETSAQGLRNRHKVRENMNTLRLLRMTQALNLSEDQAATIFPLANRLEKEKMDINAEIGRGIQELRDLDKQGNPRDEDLNARFMAIRDLRLQIRAKDDEFEKYLEELLTPGQKVKYLIFTVDFYRGVGEQLDRVRELYNRVIRRQKKNPRPGY